MIAKGFGMGFFGRSPFDKEAKKNFQEKWSKMTDEEKLAMMNKRVENMGKDRFSVEAIDARCEKWMNLSKEEKQSFVSERKNIFEARFKEMHGASGQAFGFEGCE